jgi:hypothetical protein
MVLALSSPIYLIVEKYIAYYCYAISLNPFFSCLTEGKILVEDILKLASQTEENNENEKAAR